MIEFILGGDVFQANIAQRFSARLPASFCPFDFYSQLRTLNPAPFGALLRYGNFTIASSSPERFLKLAGRRVETRPIKGTIPRSADPRGRPASSRNARCFREGPGREHHDSRPSAQ
ncbi:chorismate-binding protein [Bradyrhizobium sp. LMG 9283]|uniref:chorismate-binding protein n=1 Tax=Bradyrhizobium sp. LMG 9283 TaxID=592064 RepID=UPI00388D2B3A